MERVHWECVAQDKAILIRRSGSQLKMHGHRAAGVSSQNASSGLQLMLLSLLLLLAFKEVNLDSQTQSVSALEKQF